MKKINTILVLLSSMLFHTTATAYSNIDVEVGGYVDMQFGFRNEHNEFDKHIPSVQSLEHVTKQALVTDTVLSVKVTEQFDSMGILGQSKVGAVMLLNGDTSINKYAKPIIYVTGVGVFFLAPRDTMNNAREVYMFFENCKFGRFVYGNTHSTDHAMRINAGTVAVGNGGINGDSRLWISMASTLGNYMTDNFVTNQDSFFWLDNAFNPIFTDQGYSYGIGLELRNSAKFNYYTPQFYGFSAGITYIPDTDVYGSVANIFNVSKTNSAYQALSFKNVIEGGINYDGHFNNISYTFSILGQRGDTKQSTISNTINTDIISTKQLGGWQVGFTLNDSEYGLGIAGSYGENKGLLLGLKNAKVWTVGAGYKPNAFGISLNYINHSQISELIPLTASSYRTGKVEYKSFIVDLEYDICEGFISYVSASRFQTKLPLLGTTNSGRNNKGEIVLLGTKLIF